MKAVTFVFIAVCAMMFASCPLEDNDALWEKVYKENLGDERGDNSGIVSGTNLAAKLEWLQTNARSGGTYTIEVSADEIIRPTTLSYSGKSNISITLRGTGAVRTIDLSSNGAMFSVGSGVTLVLDGNITLRGRGNSSSLVKVSTDGTLVMNAGSTVTGNTATYGGGVYVYGTFTMNGGTISGNQSSSSSYYSSHGVTYGGGGVYVDGGTFTMSSGEISGNTCSNSSNNYSDGGGVYVDSGTFIMSGGTISGNTLTGNWGRGGGVYVDSSGIFNKTGGTIYGYSKGDTNSNEAASSGNAVYAYISSSSGKYKGTTAGPGVNLWFNNGAFSGEWDN